MRSALVGCTLVGLASGGCAATANRTPGVVVGPEASHEQCLSLQAGERVSYTYEASDDLEFNVHHHEGQRTHYPVRTSGEDVGTGELQLDRAWRACFMWLNPERRAVRLTYRLVIDDPGRAAPAPPPPDDPDQGRQARDPTPQPARR